MQAVRGDQAVERGQREVGREVGDQGRELHAGNACGDRVRVRPQRTRIPIHGDDPRARAEHVGEGERECSLPRPDVRPGATRTWDPAPDEGDVVAVVHRQPVFCRPAATPFTDIWTRRRTRGALRVVGREGTEPGQEAHLELRQGVHVRIAQPDRALEHRGPVEQVVATGHPQEQRDRAVVLRLDRLPASLAILARRERRVPAGDPHVGLGQDHLRVVEHGRQERP